MALPTTATEVLRAADGLRSYYARMHSEMVEIDRLYNLQFVIQAPKSFPVVIPGTGRRQAERMVAHITAGHLRLYAPPEKPGKKYQEIADKKEQALRVLWNVQRRKALERLRLPPHWSAVKYAVIRGYGCLKSAFDPEFWQPEPEQQEGEEKEEYEARLRRWERRRAHSAPIVLAAPDPLTLLPDPDGRFWIEDLYMPKASAELLLGRSVDHLNSTYEGLGASRVRWTEFWSQDRKIILVNGSEVVNIRNPLGFIPYVVILPGFGEPAPLQSRFSPLDGGPEIVHRSFLYIVKSELEEEARRETQIGAILHGTAWRVWQLTRDPNIPAEEADQEPEVSVAPGDLNMLRGWQLSAIDVGRFPRELFSQLQHIQLNIDDNTLPPIARGLRQGENTAYQSQIYLGVARLIMDQLKQATEAAIEQVFEHWQQMIEYIGTDVRLAGPYKDKWAEVSLKPEDINGHYAVKVSLDPNLPQDQFTRRNQFIKEWQEGVISWEQLQEEGLGNENPLEVLEKVLRDKMLRSPQIEELLARQAAEDLGWDIEALMAREEEKASRAAGGEGPPPQLVRQTLERAGAGLGMEMPPPLGVPPIPGTIKPNPAPLPGSTQEIDLILRQLRRQRPPIPPRPI